MGGRGVKYTKTKKTGYKVVGELINGVSESSNCVYCEYNALVDSCFAFLRLVPLLGA